MGNGRCIKVKFPDGGHVSYGPMMTGGRGAGTINATGPQHVKAHFLAYKIEQDPRRT